MCKRKGVWGNLCCVQCKTNFDEIMQTLFNCNFYLEHFRYGV